MRLLDGEERVLVRIFIGEEDCWRDQPLQRALLEMLRDEGFAGAIALRGLGGFGGARVLRSGGGSASHHDAPVVIEVVDSRAQAERLLMLLEGMVPEGLVTTERVHVVRFGPSHRKG